MPAVLLIVSGRARKIDIEVIQSIFIRLQRTLKKGEHKMVKPPRVPPEHDRAVGGEPALDNADVILQINEEGDEDDGALEDVQAEGDLGDENLERAALDTTDGDTGGFLENATDNDFSASTEIKPSANSLIKEVYRTNARDGLHLRSGPGVEFPVIKTIPFGTLVYLLRRENRWGLIDVQGDNAADGFVHLSFLKEVVLVTAYASLNRSPNDIQNFWAGRNPRGARLYGRDGRPLVDPQLLHASADGIVVWEAQNPNYRVEIYGPGGGFRTSGSTTNHGAQPGTGRGAALDFVLIDRITKRMLTNHPGRNNQHQGTVGQNAPLYQTLFNEVVRAGSKLYGGFISKARFGGYFATGANALDTMHIDMRGQVAQTGGGSTTAGFTKSLMSRFNIPNNYPYR